MRQSHLNMASGFGSASAGRLSQLFIRWSLRLFMVCHLAALRAAKVLGPAKRSIGDDACDILLTGTFYSENWAMSHLRPLAVSERFRRVYVVSDSPVVSLDKVETISPPGWLNRLLGANIARFAMFFWVGLRHRPSVIGGFHLPMNGLAAGLLAEITGSYSLYICCGGPAEILGGGYLTENRLFGRLKSPDAFIERCFMATVKNFDLIVVRGSRSIKFFQQQAAGATAMIITGGIDGERFRPSERPPEIDLILTGRLSTVKCVDVFLEAVRLVRETKPDVSAVVVGDGPLRSSLERMSKDLGIENNVRFVGHQDKVEEWLRRSKIFVLTSESEGLSLSMLEAMFCGLPVIVPDVGDLGDVVVDGENGYLARDRTPEEFASRMRSLLMSPDRLESFRSAARESVQRCETKNVSLLWERALMSLSGPKKSG